MKTRTNSARQKQLDENLRKVAQHYGLKRQLLKAAEEFAEVGAECARYALALDMGWADGLCYRQRGALLDELADAENMLRQLCLLLEAQTAVAAKQAGKMERQMQRLAQGVGGNAV